MFQQQRALPPDPHGLWQLHPQTLVCDMFDLHQLTHIHLLIKTLSLFNFGNTQTMASGIPFYDIFVLQKAGFFFENL